MGEIKNTYSREADKRPTPSLPLDIESIEFDWNYDMMIVELNNGRKLVTELPIEISRALPIWAIGFWIFMLVSCGAALGLLLSEHLV